MLTPAQIAKIRQKESETPDALKRNPLYNYKEGWFHVTLNTRGEAPLLGYIQGDAEAPDGTPNAPRCVLTELGKRVEESWNNNPSFYPDIENIEFQIMPEHVHGLVHLKPGNKHHLGQIVRGFMIGSSHGYWETLGIAWREMTYEKGVRTPQYNDRDHTRSFRGPALFVSGYNDMEAVTEEEIDIKRQYIRNNPRKRVITRSKPDHFRIHRQRHSPNWHAGGIMQTIGADAFFARNRDASERAQRNVMARLNSNARGVCLDYLGDAAIMASEKKLPLICHRRDAMHFEQQKQAVLDAARRGYVIVSAFISPREREIKEQLMIEQLPFIEIMDNGFSDRYKPSGKAFYACAENRLVQITCWRYLYQKDATISREQCLTMNHLALVISKTADDWWKRWKM